MNQSPFGPTLANVWQPHCLAEPLADVQFPLLAFSVFSEYFEGVFDVTAFEVGSRLI